MNKERPGPYAKRSDHSKPAYTLSPDINNITVSPQPRDTSDKEQQQKEFKPGLTSMLQVSLEKPQTFSVEVSELESGEKKIQLGDSGDSVHTFTYKPDDLSIVSDDSTLEVAFLKPNKATNTPPHKQQVNAPGSYRLFGKNPLYKRQEYKKRDHEIYFPWSVIQYKEAGSVLGIFKSSESVDMWMKDGAKTHYKIEKRKNQREINKFSQNLGMRKLCAHLEETGENGKLSITVQPEVDPFLMIVFLLVTNQLSSSSSSSSS